MKYPTLVLVILGLSSTGLCIAQAARAEQDGNKLYQSCKLAQVKQDGKANKGFGYDDYYSIGYCDGIVQGVSEALASNRLFCLPEGIRFPQLTRVVADFLETYPKARNQRASRAAYIALLRRYPCPVDN